MAKFEKKYSLEEVQSIFNERNCKLLALDYVNMLTPLEYVCSCGTQSKIRLFAFLKGSRCKECGKKKMSKQRKTPFNKVKELIEQNGYVLVSTEYVTGHTPLLMKCPEGHNCKISFTNFKSGNRCRHCFFEKNKGSNHGSWNPDRESVLRNKKFRALCKNLVHRSLKAVNVTKCKKSEELLGYTVVDLQNHITAQIPNDEKWSVDHIFPIKAFLDYNIEDLSLINALDNLQVLPFNDNSKKNCHYSKEEFEKYLKGKGIKWT